MAKRPIRLTEFSPRSLQAQGLRSDPARRDFCSAMLPGFRFLLAAILLSVSILVFGLGAAALFRTAHEEFAANPSWRAAPEPRLAQSEETTRPVLAMLHVETGAPEPRAAELPGAARSMSGPAPVAPAIAAPQPESQTAAAPAAQEIPAANEPAASEAPPADVSKPADAPPAMAAPATEEPGVTEEAKVATTEQTSPSATTSPATRGAGFEVTSDVKLEAKAEPAAAAESGSASPGIATLGGPAVAIEADAAKKAAESDREEKKRLRAERARESRRIAARRALLAKQAAAAQAVIDPFGQQQTLQMPPAPQLPQLIAATHKTR